jgi:electron transfer flavoprotein beta subunit
MAKILVCYKWVIDERDIRIDDDLSLDTSTARDKVSEWDLNAIEEGVQLAQELGGTVDALTYGTPQVQRSLKDVHSRGIDTIYWIGDALASGADGFVTANVLSAAIKKIGAYDLILCGEASSDSYSQQIAPRIATLLDLPAITYARSLTVAGTTVTAQRKLGAVMETATATWPAVVSVTGEINKPRVPGLRDVLAAGRKPGRELALGDLGLPAEQLKPKTAQTSVHGFVTKRKNVIFKDGDAAAKAGQLLAALKQENLV